MWSIIYIFTYYWPYKKLLKYLKIPIVSISDIKKLQKCLRLLLRVINYTGTSHVNNLQYNWKKILAPT